MASATDPKPDETARTPASRRGLAAGGIRGVGLSRALVGTGAAFLGCAAVATLLWSWHRSRDGLPLAVVGGTVGVLVVAGAFHVLTAARPRAAALVESALIAVGLVVLLLLIPHNLNGDDLVRFQDIEQLLNEGKVANDPYSLVMPLASVPVVALGNVVESSSWWAGRFNVVMVAIGVAIALWLLRGRIAPQLARRTVLIVLFASMLTERLRDYNAEIFTATLVCLGIIVLATGRSAIVGWGLMVIGVVNTPAAIVPLALVVGSEMLRTRRLRSVAALVAAGLLIMLEAWLRRGSPFDTGYSGNRGIHTIMPYSGLPDFSYPFLLGLLAILFSFGRGLLFFVPGLALWLSGRTRRLVQPRRAMTLMLLFTCGLVLVYAKWWAWYGGLGWGPRFFVFAAFPAALILATRIGDAATSVRADALTLAALTLSAWVSCAGIIGDLNAIQAFCGSQGFQQEQLCWFTPDYSSLWQPVRQFPQLTTSIELAALFCGLVFAYLASPLLPGLLRALRPRRAFLAGWRL